MISRMMMTWKHSNRRLQNEEEVEEKDRVLLRNSLRKKFQVRARRVPLPPKPSSPERRPKVSGHSKLLLRGNVPVPIQQILPTGTKMTKDHVTEVAFSQRVHIVYIESVCFCVQVF